MKPSKKRLFIAIISLILSTSVFGRQFLVSTDWLSKHLSDPDLVLVDLSDSLQYARFHLPNAINLPYAALNQTRRNISQSIGQSNIVKLLGQSGIKAEDHIILYDDTGGLNAARLFWELEQLGHRRQSLLNGGLVKWVRERRAISAEPLLRKPVTYLPRGTGTSASADLTEVTAASRNHKQLLLDVRSTEEYLGDQRYKRSGHIPGAVSWPWDTALNIEQGFTLQTAAILQASLRIAGVHDKQQAIITYCQSGHRAAHTYMILRELGYTHVKVYDGSMQEYAVQSSLALKLGNTP